MQTIKDQYATSKNLETRISIYQFAAEPQTWPQWLAEQIAPGQHLRILELGCGTGGLWLALRPSFSDCEIILSDYSAAMLAKAQAALGPAGFQYQRIDYHHIPYPAGHFDVVISNHNLYHAADLEGVLGEVARVLKPGGRFYASTNSADHLAELRQLIELDRDTLWPNTLLVSAFGAETGAEVLGKHFPQVEQRFYQNRLHITDFGVIADYLMSVRDVRVHEKLAESMERLQQKFAVEISTRGYFEIRTKACLFISA